MYTVIMDPEFCIALGAPISLVKIQTLRAILNSENPTSNRINHQDLFYNTDLDKKQKINQVFSMAIEKCCPSFYDLTEPHYLRPRHNIFNLI